MHSAFQTPHRTDTIASIALPFTDYSPAAPIIRVGPTEVTVPFSFSSWGADGNAESVKTVRIIPAADDSLPLTIAERSFDVSSIGGPIANLWEDVDDAAAAVVAWFALPERLRPMLPDSSYQGIHSAIWLLDHGLRVQHKLDLSLYDMVRCISLVFSPRFVPDMLVSWCRLTTPSASSKMPARQSIAMARPAVRLAYAVMALLTPGLAARQEAPAGHRQALLPRGRGHLTTAQAETAHTATVEAAPVEAAPMAVRPSTSRTTSRVKR